MHDIARRSKLLKLSKAHKGKVSELCFASAERLLSCGVDGKVKMWDLKKGYESYNESDAGPSSVAVGGLYPYQ